jgi:hypothetical protein
MHHDDHKQASPSPDGDSQLANHKIASQDEWNRERLALLKKREGGDEATRRTERTTTSTPVGQSGQGLHLHDHGWGVTLTDLFEGRS